MYKNLRWKLLSILAVAAIAVAAFYPPSKRLHYGLDLQGGVHLVLRVNTDDALKLETETDADQLREALTKAAITVTSIQASGPSQFQVIGVPSDKDAQFRQLADEQVDPAAFDHEGVGGTYTFRMKPNIMIARREETVTQAVQTIERRVNELGVSEPIVAPYGSRGDEIVVQLPGETNVAHAMTIVQQTAMLELKMVEGGPLNDKAQLLQPYNGQLPADMDIVQGPSTGPAGQPASVEYYLVHKTPALTGRDLSTAREKPDNFNQPSVGFTLKNAGVVKFTKVTTDNVGKTLAIVLDNRVQSAPRIDSVIASSDAEITGHFTMQEANDLALVLRSGALPASMDYLEQRVVGPTLGKDSIRAGVTASIIGLVFVVVFMLGYYRLAGINALVSIVLNLLILLGFMAYLGSVLTLPGIAGFILTIGMGVDSNVLIFERIREEIAHNKGIRQAVAAGFDRVFITILDTHISSLISAAFLFQFGTGPIRGFATTLFFGLISNVFTAVFVSRAMFEFVLSRKPAGATKLSI